MKRRIASFIVLLYAALLGAGTAFAQAEAPRRVALVVGNNAYPTAPLVNPVNDAKAMAAALQAAGFEVTLRLDITQGGMVSAVREFGNVLKTGGAGTLGLFYFAGHGMQIKGRNYLIPVGANIEHEDEVAYQAMDAQAVLDKMESAGNGANLLILDACRNNPFARSFRSAGPGLVPMEAPVGTLVAFATAPGSVASDGNGTNGLYTLHLLEAMRRPGVKVEDVFKQVRSSVRRASQGRQVPMEWSSLEGDFYFVPAGNGAALAAVPSVVVAPDPTASIQAARQQAEELARWGAVGTDRRPPSPRVNVHGIALGDRYRYHVFDRADRDRHLSTLFLRVDDIGSDGGLLANQGEVELDARGQLIRFSADDDAAWEGWTTPLPVAEVAASAGPDRIEIDTECRTGGREGWIAVARVHAVLTRAGVEPVRTAAGEFTARRVDVVMQGRVERSGQRPAAADWRRSYWFVDGLALPVAWRLEERHDRRLVREWRYELAAHDVLRYRPVVAGATP